ncbi:EAL domain-containing protein [Colwellia sp. E2M01]|uniref:EAL domain-containing protein n=1 Tax=Colwellia sp. E2M01 TaxID=2841561 RepID=UPI001C08DD91|nr:EAL domain-containing protein [Colwellia sp. E2M01]MBU2870132.1 EAL domain-containing protein [Colwellia sp. E2M01]
MNRFNAKYFLLFIILIVVIAISVLFAQIYSDKLPMSALDIIGYISVIIGVTILALYFLPKVFAAESFNDASKRVSAEDFFSFTHDPATNLPTAQQALIAFESTMKVDMGQRYAAVVFKPINFQQVNSLIGYHNSDLLLLQLAYCLQQQVVNNPKLLDFSMGAKPPVRIARLQSLQFLVFYNLTDSRFDDQSMVNEVCQQIAASVPEAMSFKSFSLNFELAFGVAISGDSGDNFDEVIAHAGDALLNGLKQEKQINYFDNNSILYSAVLLSRMEALRQDIEEEKLFCYLKPQVNINNHNIIGFELKVHWYEKDAEKPLGLSEFVELAEHSGELYTLTKFMLNQALSTIAQLHAIGVYQRISVTLSSESLFEVDLVDYIDQQLQKHNVSGRYLMIELNEQVMLSASSRVKLIIDQLKSLEIQISIANFSGSYESLRYVRKMAIQQLKINCRGLTNDGSNRVDKAITNSLVTLTRSMKIPLVGTNIDRHEASEAYIAMGGELMQGDIIHQGVVPEEIEIWLEKWYLQHPESIPPEAKPSIY